MEWVILPSHLLGRQRSGEACIKEVKHPEQTDVLVQWPLECFSSGPWIGSPPSRREEPQMHDNFTKICTRKWWKEAANRSSFSFFRHSQYYFALCRSEDLKRGAIVQFLLDLPFGIVWKKTCGRLAACSLRYNTLSTPLRADTLSGW